MASCDVECRSRSARRRFRLRRSAVLRSKDCSQTLLEVLRRGDQKLLTKDQHATIEEYASDRSGDSRTVQQRLDSIEFLLQCMLNNLLMQICDASTLCPQASGIPAHTLHLQCHAARRIQRGLRRWKTKQDQKIIDRSRSSEACMGGLDAEVVVPKSNVVPSIAAGDYEVDVGADAVAEEKVEAMYVASEPSASELSSQISESDLMCDECGLPINRLGADGEYEGDGCDTFSKYLHSSCLSEYSDQRGEWRFCTSCLAAHEQVSVATTAGSQMKPPMLGDFRLAPQAFWEGLYKSFHAPPGTDLENWSEKETGEFVMQLLAQYKESSSPVEGFNQLRNGIAIAIGRAPPSSVPWLKQILEDAKCKFEESISRTQRV